MLVIGFSCLLLAEFGSEALTDDNDYFQEHQWPMALAFLVTGLILIGFRGSFDSTESRRVRDLDTGEEFSVHYDETEFMFIPFRFWPILLAVGSAALALAEVLL